MVKVQFRNRTANTNYSFSIEEEGIPHVLRWYAGYHGGDVYSVYIDGDRVGVDENGEVRA